MAGRRAPRTLAAAAAVLLWSAVGTAQAAPADTPALASPDAAERLLLDIAADGGRIVAVGEQGHIIVSDDEGGTWSHAEVPVSLMLTGVAFAGDTKAWAVGHDGVVLASDDRGDRWRVAVDGAAIVAMQIEAARENIARIEVTLDAMADDDPAREETGFTLEDAQFDLEDAQELAEGGITSPLLGVRFTSATRGYVFGAYGVLLQTEDGGETWALIADRLDNPDNQHLYSLAVTEAGNLLLVGEAGAAFRSEDDGATWTRLDLNYEGSLFGVLALSGGEAVAYGLRGRIFHSPDEGENWTEIDGSPRATLTGGTALPDGRTALVGAAGTLVVGKPGATPLDRVATPMSGGLSGALALDSNTLIVVGFGGLARVALDGDDAAGD